MSRLVRGLLFGGLAVATLAGEALSAPTGEVARQLPSDEGWRLCTDTAGQIELKERLPQSILEAITTVETGRAAQGETIARPWPWTVTAEGKGQHYPTKKVAIEAVRALRARGVDSIDVGCMQVNLHYHPGAFTSLEEAFEPSSNIAYAASLLGDLRKAQGSWETAIEHYHSYDPEIRLAYRLRVFSSWQSIINERNAFRLASEVSLDRMGMPGQTVHLDSSAGDQAPPLTGALQPRHRATTVLEGPVLRLTSLDPPSAQDTGHATPRAALVVIAVDLRPRASDRPDAAEASVLGRTTVAVAEPAARPLHD
jgi:hypothetical protein